LPQLIERVRHAGFTITRAGSVTDSGEPDNNISYAITAPGATKIIYAIVFPLLNALAWLGQWSQPSMVQVHGYRRKEIGASSSTQLDRRRQ